MTVKRSLEVERILLGEFSSPGVFTPTATSRLLASLAVGKVNPGDSILDLGCGSGVVGLQIAQSLHGQVHLSMSDVSAHAVQVAKANASKLGFAADVRSGDLLAPWGSQRFDVIVSDVSGVVPRLGQQLGWFTGVSNDSGSRGIDLATQVVSLSPQSLEVGGRLLMPILSLSDEKALHKVMTNTFSSVTLLGETALPLPAGANVGDIRDRDPFIRLDSIAGVNVFYTSVWCLS